MVTLPDGTQFDMQWKKVTYIKEGHSAAFEIYPMFYGADIVMMPTAYLWENAQSVFSGQERLEIIVLLERIRWKRDLRVVEGNILPEVDANEPPVKGSLESTLGYQVISDENIFDPQSTLTNEEAKEIFCILERRFAEEAKGIVKVPKDVILKNSILEQVSMPALLANKDATVVWI